jgi:hypothetical protein
MDILNDMINHPNFGRLMESSHGFRSAFNNKLSDSTFSEAYPTIRVGSSADGGLSLSIANDSRKIIREPGQSGSDYFAKAMSQADEGYSSFRTGATRTGGFSNQRLRMLGDLYGVDFEIGSVNMSGQNAAAQIQRMTENGLGYSIVDEKTSTVIRAKNRASGKYTKMDDIFEMQGIDPSTSDKFKRFKAFTNEMPLEAAYAPGGRRIGVAVLPAEGLFGNAAQLENQIMTEARRRGLTAHSDIRALREEVFEKASDGSLLISRSALNRQIAMATSERDNLATALKKIEREKISQGGQAGLARFKKTSEYLDQKKQISKIDSTLRQIRKNSSKGLSVNARIFNGINTSDGTSFSFSKGEGMVTEDMDFVASARRGAAKDSLLNKMSDREILESTDYITTSTNISTTDLTREGSKLKPSEKISFATSNPDKLPGRARSNTLSAATFNNFMNPDNYLIDSLNNAIKEDMASLAKGDLSPGLRAIIREIEDTPTEGLARSERAMLSESKEFARRIKTFVDQGGDLRENPFLSGQMMDQIKSHYLTPAMDSEGSQKAYRLGGRSIQALDGRFPMEGSTLAHLGSLGMKGVPLDEAKQGVLQIDHDAGRFGISALDATNTHKAFGGFDFDDSLYTTYHYDTNTRRLLVKALRDPNAMGEYMIFDADISHDNNIPKEVRDLYKKHEGLNKSIARGHRKKIPNADMKRMLDELNNTKSKLDSFFSGKKKVMEAGEEVSLDFIKKINIEQLQANGFPAPADLEWDTSNFLRKSSHLSFAQMDTSDVSALSRAIASERQGFIDGENFSMFKANKGYSEYESLFKVPVTSAVKAPAEKMDYQFIMRKLQEAQANNGILGQTINQYTLIDNFIGEHLDFNGTNEVDPKMKTKLRELLKDPKYQLERIDRETLIDAIVKEPNESVNIAVNRGKTKNMEALGGIVSELNRYAEEQGIKFKSGLDPILFQERIESMPEMVNAFRRGFGPGNFLLDEADSKANFSRLMKAQVNILDDFKTTTDEALELTRKNLSEVIGNKFTPKQITQAQDIIQDFEQSQELVRNADYDAIARGGLAGDLTVDQMDNYSRRATNLKTLSRLKGSSSQDLRAIVRVLLDSGDDLSLINQSVDIGNGFGQTINDILSSAINEEKTFSEIDGIIERPNDIFKFIERGDDGSLSFTAKSNMVISQPERNRRLSKAINANITVSDEALRLGDIGELGNRMNLSQMFDFIGQQEKVATNTVQIPNQVGAKARAYRAISDEAAEEVLKDKPAPLIRRLFAGDRAMSKSARSGLAALAVFAGFGVAHRIVTGDRTESQLNPYPLIPQNSQYEDILNKSDMSFDPMTTNNNSTTYTIRANNYSDTEALTKGIQGVLPNGMTTIYNSQSPSFNNYNSSALDILSQRQ